jgi:hypothetical protein
VPYTSYARPVPAYPRPPAPVTSGEPVHIDETGRTPDGPPTATDLSYEARLRSSYNAAQGMQGPLDGRWTLVGPGGQALYSLQLVDSGLGAGLEGAWGDPRRKGAVDGSGFLDDIQRSGADLFLRFAPKPGAELTVVALRPTPDGRWTGEIYEKGDRKLVTLRREGP